ncbi:MAG TPA: NAD(P)-dependent oxidoreductase [Phycisphaerales bacterium]|nr:NAD(P)-dependent oxidoreductase [Phycisphaerales bacterium]
MKILVTGGSGFIGSYFLERLAEQGHELVVLDLVDPPGRAPRHTFYKGDIRDRAALERAMSGCERVIHLAAAHHDFGIEYDTYFSVNERGSRTMCEVLDDLGVRDVVFYSTVAVYGEAPEPHHEEADKKPNTPYGASKLAGEAVFREWTEKGGGRRCLVIRPTVTFGPRNFANMYSLIRQVHSGKYFEFGPGENIKSLSYVENTVDATLFLLDKQGRPAFDVYNYIDKPDLTSRQITHAVYLSLGKKAPGLTLPMWAGLLLALPFDLAIALTGKNLPISSARLKKLYQVQTKFEADKLLAAGYKPRVLLTDGIDRMVKWYLAEGRTQRAVWHLPPKETLVTTPEPELV